ncbi:hypothetical protein ACQ4PT_058507 [Festuca glaucescens]
MAGRVVAIASFNGGTRAFACTGVFIEHGECYQRILTSASLIEVRLLNKRRAKGELVYCNFEYNIALVDIKESAHHPAGIGGPLIDTHGIFVGMNFYGDEETPFLPVSTLKEILDNNDSEWPDAENMAYTGQNRWFVPLPTWCYPELKETVVEDTLPPGWYPEGPKLTELDLEDGVLTE